MSSDALIPVTLLTASLSAPLRRYGVILAQLRLPSRETRDYAPLSDITRCLSKKCISRILSRAHRGTSETNLTATEPKT